MTTDYDFGIRTSDLLRIARDLDIENPGGAVTTVVQGERRVAAVIHTSDVRPDMLTYLLAVAIYESLTGSEDDCRPCAGHVLDELTDIMHDLEPGYGTTQNRHVTYWNNVGLMDD